MGAGAIPVCSLSVSIRSIPCATYQLVPKGEVLCCAQALELDFYMFSRQTMIMSAGQVDDSGHYPMHQPDSIVGQEVRLLLAWLSCMTMSASS